MHIFASLPAFVLASAIGYFLLPRLLSLATLSFFFSGATNLESGWRDRLFLPLTRRMNGVSPNAVTYIGFAVTVILVYLFWIEAPFEVLFAAILIAGFTDMFDGPLARNNNRVTQLGTRLDWMRDLLLTIVIGVSLTVYGILPVEFLLWFLAGWGVLGLLRIAEFKLTNGTLLNTDDDYKFILDRARLALMWIAVLLLVMQSYHAAFGAIGNALAVISIVLSVLSVAFHAAHLKVLKTGNVPISR